MTNQSGNAADEWAIRLASGGRIGARVVVVVAHADDETLFAGPLLARLDDGLLIHVTDGAPRDMADARRLGFATREDYAAARAGELDHAVTALTARVARRAYGIADQGATAALTAIVDRLVDDLDGAAVVATHPYEGGHPDHDAVALAVAVAIARMGASGRAAPIHVEFASYHLLEDVRVWARFWPASDCPERTRPFTSVDVARVAAALAAHATQAAVFDTWRPDTERWRAAPPYDFLRPPPPSACLYDRFGWAITSSWWREAARMLLAQETGQSSGTPLSIGSYRKLSQEFRHMTIKSPVRFDPSVEQVKPDEQEVIDQLNGSFKDILETTSQDYGHAVRSVHAKAHGIFKGTLTVRSDLPAELAQGIFSHPATYEAIGRISTNAGDILDDSIALPRGFALKLMGVEGDRLPGSEGDVTQDFILVNGPVFSAPDAKAFAKNLKLLAGTTDKAEWGKKLISAVFRTIEAPLEAIGLPSATLQQLGGAPNVHPLGETYFSQTPFRYGDHIAKFSLVPVSSALTELTGDIVSTHDRPDALREVVNEVLRSQGGTWELRVQLNRDLESMPVEDPTKLWDEKESPFVTVATLEVPHQPSWVHGESDAVDDVLSYSIWHGIAAHRPLGNINRARNTTYRLSAKFRGEFNGCPLHQPRQLADLP